MRVVQAPWTYKKKSTEIACFLAGGCQSTEWSEIVLKRLEEYTPNHLVIYNPYNPDIKDNFEQIKWEFEYLNCYKNDHFIFSCYFDKYTDQPMSMYELGRASVLCKEQAVKVGPWNDPFMNNTQCFHLAWGFPMVVSVHPEAPKKESILAQCKLAEVHVKVQTPEEHAKDIIFWYRDIKRQMM